MRLTIFKYYIRNVVIEGNRLQKLDLAGKSDSSEGYMSTQFVSFGLAIVMVIFVPTGFSNEFAGFTMSFLAIFIGLFSNIVISLHSNSRSLFDDFNKKSDEERAKIRLIRNYLVQFTGLSSYAILLALMLTLLLSLLLLDNFFHIDLNNYEFVHDLGNINAESVICFVQLSLIILYRFSIAYFFLNFLAIATYAITTYFSFLGKRYKEMVHD